MNIEMLKRLFLKEIKKITTPDRSKIFTPIDVQLDESIKRINAGLEKDKKENSSKTTIKDTPDKGSNE